MTFNPDSNIAGQWEDLTIYQNRDADLTVTLTDPTTISPLNPVGLPYSLVGLAVNFIRKLNREAPDLTGKSYSCTIATPSSGIVTVTLPAADNTLAGVTWYRIDLVGTETKAIKFGRLNVYAV